MAQNQNLISVKFQIKDGKKYYQNHKWKYELEEQDAVIEELPDDTQSNYRFYYYTLSGWIKDEEMYKEYIQQIEREKIEREKEQKEDKQITLEELATAVAELAEIVLGGK